MSRVYAQLFKMRSTHADCEEGSPACNKACETELLATLECVELD